MANTLRNTRFHSHSGVKEECTLYYRMIKTKDESSDFPDVFSILIIKVGSEPESSFFYDVTRNGETAKKLLDLLHNGSVTPLSAEYIISDFLAENV